MKISIICRLDVCMLGFTLVMLRTRSKDTFCTIVTTQLGSSKHVTRMNLTAAMNIPQLLSTLTDARIKYLHVHLKFVVPYLFSHYLLKSAY